ncbi:MAG TPA: SDR family oxidoreductase [Sandaracinaceae bacterium LLY-WYZ-13_1]|nr:SDR family oxidoreductase [Sandaracinaceae bacterium LLY-WYZ-13_1]
MTDVRFDGRVAIVTGAGGGLGRSHALLLASRGAKVVVNDLGGTVDGQGSDQAAAQKVVDEITGAGGEAVASFDGVDTAEGGQKIVQTALEAFGKVDVVINNAGILRDVSFHKMSIDDWDAVLKVHLAGTFYVSHAAWPHLREAGYGRIVNTTSAAGLYGNFGQANYGAAKLGIVGLTKTLAQEGYKKGIRANVIAPVAKSRMTETILDDATLAKLDPSLVSPLVAYLASESCDETGQVYAVGGGYVSRVAMVEGSGTFFPGGDLTPEQVAESWATINDLSQARPYANAMEAVQVALAKATGKA